MGTPQNACLCSFVLERDREALAEIEAREWEQRRIEIERQAEETRREKKRRRADAEIAQRSQVLPTSCDYACLQRAVFKAGCPPQTSLDM